MGSVNIVKILHGGLLWQGEGGVQASLHRAGELIERFREVATAIRIFHFRERNVPLAASTPFQFPVVK